jgi:hypothetical protein
MHPYVTRGTMGLVVLEPPARLLPVTLLVLGMPRPIDRGRASEPGRPRGPMWLNARG